VLERFENWYYGMEIVAAAPRETARAAGGLAPRVDCRFPIPEDIVPVLGRYSVPFYVAAVCQMEMASDGEDFDMGLVRLDMK
jgi:hypothetical protein